MVIIAHSLKIHLKNSIFTCLCIIAVCENGNAPADDSDHDYDAEPYQNGDMEDNPLPPLSTSLFSVVPDCESEENGIKEERLR